MGRNGNLDRLPLAYGVALRLHDAGAGHETIATALGVDLVSVPAMLDLAQRKLDEMDEARDERRNLTPRERA